MRLNAMDRFETEAVVIGAGAVGLACAAELARRGLEVIVLEAASIIGSGTSSRNSEVIHAGIYYPNGSLKHKACVSGRRALYQYLSERGVSYRKCSKLIVATNSAEDEQISKLHQLGQLNGVEGLDLISGSAARALEPELFCTSALVSHETGIFDSHGYMLALLGEIEDHRGSLALECSVTRCRSLGPNNFEVETGGSSPTLLQTPILVNATGLHAQALARQMEGFDPDLVPPLYLAKGSYFRFAGKPAFSRLIYPAPVNGGLGVHVTLDLQGQMRFGPDVEWLDTSSPEDVAYRVEPERAKNFYAAVRSYWPNLPDDTIQPDYSGCRPKLTAKGQPAGDFMVQTSDHHGIDGLVHMFGIESPGLTASLELARQIGVHLTENRAVTACM
jgi:L-2-hydroxyglutarate oxidase LhgO